MYTGDLETLLQVQFIDLPDPLLNIIHFSVFIHNPLIKYDMSGYGAEESSAVDIHEIVT